MRAFNRLLGLLAGLALAGAGGFTVVEVILAAFHKGFVVVPGRAWLRALRTTPWTAPDAKIVVIAVAAVGLILVLAEIRPWRRRRARLAASPGPGDWWVLRRSAEAHLRRTLMAETAASRPRLRLVPRRRRWRARIVTVAPAQFRQEIRDAAQQEMERLGAPPGSVVKVKLSKTRRVA